jgi:hypothetical protein
MIQYKRFTKSLAMLIVVATLASVSAFNKVAAEDETSTVAFPDKYMIRLGAYIVENANTQFSVNSGAAGIGTVIDYQRDLNGDSDDIIPRIDGYYRFNERHRVDFTYFSLDRKGTRTLAIEPPITIDGEDYSGGTINSDIKYTLYKVGYAYSFYHSSKMEASLSAGLNITNYDLKFANDAGDKVESAGVTAPLPMFGLRMGYAITPKWYVHYVSEVFFIDFDDTVRGSLLSYELNTEYKLFKSFSLGAGLARISTNIEVNDDDWRGSITDGYRGITVFGTFYF